MLSEMYKGWSSNRRFNAQDVDLSPCEGGGYKSITTQIEGERDSSVKFR